MKHIELESGLLVPEAYAKGKYTFQLFDKEGRLKDEWEQENTVIIEGLIAMMNATFAGGSAVTNWYIALFTNNYTPVSTDTASSIVGNAGEFTSYSGGTRPAFTATAAAQPTANINNTASKANFTFTAGATLMGAFLISSATIGSNTGTLYSAVNTGAKVVSNTDTMAVGYSTSLTSA